MFLVPNIDQMYKEMKKFVEVGNKHGNGDEFPDFADLFSFGIKNVSVGGKILRSDGRPETHIFFFWPYYALIKFGNFDCLKKVLFLDYDLDLASLNNKYNHRH
jgi:hypothetical protein